MPFVLYRSSAGSGKTFTLVKEYLKIVLVNPGDFSHILALTFTNKAAQEMKDRILTYLGQLSDYAPEHAGISITSLMEQLMLDTGLDQATIKQRSARVLQLILHHYSDFSVTTIDSFMHRVIRTFAHDLNLPLDFEVELDQDILIKQAVNNLIQQVGTDHLLTRALIDYVLYKSGNEKGWNVEKDLEKMGGQLFQESGQLAMETMQQQAIGLDGYTGIFLRIRILRNDFEKRVVAIGKQAIEVIELHDIDPSSFFMGKNGIAGYFENIANGRIEKIEPGKNTCKTIEEDTWYAKGQALEEKTRIDNAKESLSDLFRKIEHLRETEYPVYISLGIIERNILPLALLHRIDQELQAIKKENKLLPIGEFNKRIADSILNEPIPFIFERLGEWYNYYLLDEFQDTSVLQWLNLLPLVENSLAGGYTSILVGDGKQAIYRFRNGDVEQFSRLPQVFLPPNLSIPEGRKLILARHYKEFPLEWNYRTAAEIVQFNNEFFTVLSSFLSTGMQPVYQGVSQKTLETKPGGFVSIEFQYDEDEELSVNDAQLGRILAIVRQCIADGYALRDIAVLCRSNIQGSLVSRYLMDNKISVSSSESILLKNSPRVNALLACLRVITNPADLVSQAVIRQYWTQYEAGSNRCLTDGQPSGIQLAHWHIGTLAHQTAGSTRQNTTLSDDYRGIPLYELTEKLVRDLAMDDLPDPFIIFFLDAVLQFSRSLDSSLAGFLEFWDKNKGKLSLKTPEDFDAVRVMTIHKAKGLEFSVVIYPFANEEKKPARDTVWVNFHDKRLPELKTVLVPVNKELEKSSFSETYEEEQAKSTLDFLNLLYVAMTRPKDRLYVLTNLPGNKFMEGRRISDLFGIYLDSIGKVPATQGRYVRGKETRKKEPAEPGEKAFTFRTIHSVDWASRISVRRNHPGDWDVEFPDKPRTFGNLLHDILSEIRIFGDFTPVCRKYLEHGLLLPEEQEKLLLQMTQLADDPDMAVFFNEIADIRNETEILTEDGRSYRPDRLVMYTDKTLILDYKTGAPHEYYQKQVLHYADLLKEMGCPKVEAWLLYLEQPHRLQKVS